MSLTRAAVVVATPAVVTPAPSSVLARTCDCGSHTSGEMCSACAKDQQKKWRVSRFAERIEPARHASGSGPFSPVPPIVHGVLRESGRPIPPDLRAFMEPRFGADFSEVRLHTDGSAARSSSAVGAAAYTVGPHIVFGANRYQPETPAGRRLLAHELTHVLQQRADGGEQPPESISDPADASEHEAEATADRVLATPTQAPDVTPARSAVQRRELSTGEKVGIGIGVGAAALGISALIAWAAGAFDKETFTEDELIEYFNGLAATRTPAGGTIGDNKARDAVRKWRAHSTRINLDNGHRGPNGTLTAVDLKRLLISEMLDGPTTGSDEDAIITIIEHSSADDVLVLLDPSLGVSVQDLDDNIGGDNHDRLEAVLEAKFPSGSTVRTQQTRASGCSARQSLMLSYARQTALRWVENAITSLMRLDDAAVQQALDCRFKGATRAHRVQIIKRFQQVLQLLPQRLYKCGAERGPAALEPIMLRGTDGQMRPANCLAEDAASLVSTDETLQPEVALCPAFFGRDPETQAVTIVHESVHAAGVHEDPAYQPGCGLALETALANPDSFAYLVRDLATLTGNVTDTAARATLPSVSVGNFRNRGPVSDDNLSPLGREVPGLGPDVNTGLNIMEIRGDITGHRNGVQYEFRRTKEVAIWRKASGVWQRLRYVAPGTDDDMLNRDESLTPQNNHIYSMDGAGLEDLASPLRERTAGADEAVYKASFLESVEARVPPAGWTRVSNEFPWHTVTWLERGPGAWTRKAGKNELEAGPMTIGTDPPEPAAPESESAPTMEEPTPAQQTPTVTPGGPNP